MHWSYYGGHLKFPKLRYVCLLKDFTLVRYSNTDLCKIQIYARRTQPITSANATPKTSVSSTT